MIKQLRFLIAEFLLNLAFTTIPKDTPESESLAKSIITYFEGIK